MTTPQAKRAAALKAMEKHAITQRRACCLVSVDPKTVRREPVPDNPEVRAKMREIAEQRRRFGYRRIGVMLERDGIVIDHKKLRRLYAEEGLSVKQRRGRKRASGIRAPMLEPSGPPVRWSLDFVADTFGDGRRFRILAVIDDVTRESLALVTDTSLSGSRVARELDRIVRLYGLFGDDGVRQRDGVRLARHAGLAEPDGRGLALHRARQASAKRVRRKL